MVPALLLPSGPFFLALITSNPFSGDVALANATYASNNNNNNQGTHAN